MAAPDQYRFGIELEIIALPHRPDDTLTPADYYEKLAKSLKKRGLDAKAESATERYRKHPEQYKTRWWICRDGSLQNNVVPGEIAFEAVSPILTTRGTDWEWAVETFWESQKKVFHMPKREGPCGTHIHISPGQNSTWSLSQLKDIAVGVIVYEAEIQRMLPTWRRDNIYCKRNTIISTRLSSLPADANSKRRDLSSRLYNVKTKADLCDFMQQANRYVLWNFFNLRESSMSGTIEFRGGRGLRGPIRTKRWIAFTIAIVDFLLHECLHSNSNSPSVFGVDELYRRLRRSKMGQFLPADYRVLNESIRDDADDDDESAYGSDPSDMEPAVFVPKDAEPPRYIANPPAAVTRGYASDPVSYQYQSHPRYEPPQRQATSDDVGCCDCNPNWCCFLRLRGVEWICTLIVGGIAGGIIIVGGSGPSEINYCLFLAVFTGLLLVPLTIFRAERRVTLFALECLNILFWFCGALALTVKATSLSCDESMNDLLCNGAKALCAFLWTGLVSLSFSLCVAQAQFTGDSHSGNSC